MAVSSVAKTQEVKFSDLSILAVVLEDGQPYFSLKRACETLGISFQPQFKRFQTDTLLSKSTTTVYMEDASGRVNSKPMLLVHKDALPFWLSLINPNRVRDEVKEKLEVFRNQAYIALNLWFNHGLENGFPEELSETLVEETVEERSSRQEADIVQAIRGVKGMMKEAERIYKALERKIRSQKLLSFRDASLITGLGEKEIINHFRDKGYIHKVPGSTVNLPSSFGKSKGIVDSTSPKANVQLTPKGLLYIENVFSSRINKRF